MNTKRLTVLGTALAVLAGCGGGEAAGDEEPRLTDRSTCAEFTAASREAQSSYAVRQPAGGPQLRSALRDWCREDPKLVLGDAAAQFNEGDPAPEPGYADTEPSYADKYSPEVLAVIERMH